MQRGLALSPRLPPFFVRQFTFSIVHKSGTSTSVYYPERKLKNKKWGGLGRRLRGASSDDQQEVVGVMSAP